MKKVAFLFLIVVCLAVLVFAQAESEWKWESLTDGTAKITGYTGEDTGVLIIPREINGKPVSAIADSALAGDKSLRAVTIPQRVREIGENALGDADVEVRGWNGSYAQNWAAAQGKRFHNLSFYNLFDGVMDLSGIDLRISGNEIILDSADAAGITAGRMIVRSGDEDITELQAFIVTGVGTGGGKTTLTVKAQEPLTAVESYRLELNDVVLEPEGTRTSRGMSTVPENGKAETSVTYTADGSSVTITHSSKTRVQGYYDYKFSQKQQGYFQIVTEDTITQKTQGMTSLKQISKKAREFVKSMKAISGGGNVLSTGVHDAQGMKDICTIGAKTKVDLSAATIGTSKYTLRTTKIVRIDGEDVQVVREEVDEDKHPEMEMSGYIKIGLDTSLGIDLKLGSNLSIGSSTSLTLKVEEAPQYDSEVKCYDAKVVYTSGFGVKGKLGLTTPKNKAGQSVSVNFKNIDLPMGPQTQIELAPFGFHLEFRDNPENGFPSVEKMKYCSVLPKDQYVIRFHTGTYTQIEDLYGKAGSTISEPEKKPVAASKLITFLNWSTSETENIPYDFNKPLPEVSEEDALKRDGPNVLDLWAMWSSPYRELTIDLNYDNMEKKYLHILPGEYVKSEDRPVAPLRKYYRFLGWEATGIVDGIISMRREWDFLGDPMPDMDVTVKAIWGEYDENYDPVEEAVTQLEEDEELRARMNREFKGRTFMSTEMQGMGAYSAFNNWRILNLGFYGITGYTGDSPVVSIPDTINGAPVVYLDGSGWENKASLQALIVPSTTCIIGGFKNFPNLRYVLFRDDDRVYKGTGDVELRFVGVETLRDSCFQNCQNLQTVNFPRYLHSIGSYAFQGTSITEADLALTNCTSIGAHAFESCKQLAKVTLTSDIEWLNTMVFAYCENLKHINLDYVKAYCYGCLADTGFEVLELPNAYKLDDDIVTACRKLKRLKIVLHETSLDTNAASIHHVNELADVELVRCALNISEAPSLVTYSIDGFEYDGSRSGKLSWRLLDGLPNLRLVEIRNSRLFHLNINDCEKLQSIDMTGSELYWSEGHNFSGYSHREVYLTNLPELSRLIYKADNGCWTDVYLENVALTAMDMNDWYLGSFVAIDCPKLKEVKLSELPEAVNVQVNVSIRNTAIEELALPTGQGSVTMNVNNNPQLKRILLPNTLTKLNGGFADNPELNYVRLPANNQIVLNKNCFKKCTKLTKLTIPACWTAEQMYKDLLTDSYVSCLNVDGSADVSNLTPKGELFVAETTEGSTAWNALQKKGFLMRPSGAGWRAVRFKYIDEKNSYYSNNGVLTPSVFDHPDLIGNQLIQTTPGNVFIMPAVVMGNNYEINEYTAGNIPVTDPMIAPDADITIKATCSLPPQMTYKLVEGGVRLMSIANSERLTVLYIPDAVDGYAVVEVDPGVYTAGAYTEIHLPSTLLRFSGEDFAECTALKKLSGKGDCWTTSGGILYGTDSAGKTTSLILCPQQYEGVLTLPETVKTINSYAIKNVIGLTGLNGSGLTTIQKQAVTGYNGITTIAFAAGLEEIQADNFRSSPLESVTFAGDAIITDDAFVPGSTVRFFGPENAANILAWADRNGQKYNVYGLTMATEGSEMTIDVRAGSTLSIYEPNERKGYDFLGWSEDADAEEPVLIAFMPAGNLRVEAVWQKSDTEAEQEEKSDELTADLVTEELEDGTLTIIRYKGKNSRPYIPDEIHGKAVTAIGDYAFAGNQTAAVVILPDSITTVGEHAFDSACALLDIEFKANNVAFGESALANCDSLRTVRLPAGQKMLPKRMFAGCRSLITAEIPATVKEIGEEAFAGCTDLCTLTLPAGLESFSADAVRNAPLRSIYINKGSTKLAGDGTAVWTADGKTLLYVCPTAAEVNIPATITTIGEFAARGCEQITEVTLPEGLTTIGKGAFMGSGLKSIRFPKSLKTIGDYAFENCDRPDTVYVADSVTEIGDDVFGDNDVLIYVDSKTGIPYRTLSEKYKVLVQAVQTPVTGISFTEDEITLKQKETVQLMPVFEPAGAKDSRLLWTLGESNWDDVVELTQDGVITGVRNGTQKLYVETARGLRAEMTITVTNEEMPDPEIVTDVTLSTLNGLSKKCFFGFFDGVAYLSAESGGNMTAKTGSLTMSVDSTWFEISCPEYPGLFEASRTYSYYVRKMPEGKDVVDCTMVIEGTDGKSLGFRKEIPCRVFRDTFDISRKISLPSSLSLFVGDSVQVDEYTEGLFNTPFSRAMGYAFMSSNPEVAEVDKTGHIQAKKPGTATIRVAGMAKNGTCVILVRENAIEMNASLSSERILQGKSEQLTASVNDPTVTIEYSSGNEKIATISENGVIDFVSRGNTLISVRAVRDGRVLAGRNWQIRTLVPYTGWNVSNMTEIPGIGEAFTIDISQDEVSLSTYARSDYGQYSVDSSTIQWSSSDESILNIEENGLAKPLKSGVVTLKGKLEYNGDEIEVKACCDYWFGSANIEWISESGMSVSVGESKPLEFLIQTTGNGITPTFAATNASYYGYSSGKVTVDENGIVTGVTPGSAYVTMRLINRYGCQISESQLYIHVLSPGESTAIENLPESVEMFAGESLTLADGKTLKPAGAVISGNDKVSTDDEGIAGISATGNKIILTGVKPGMTTARISLYYGEEYKIPVTVKKPDVYGAIENAPKIIIKGKTIKLKAVEVQPGGTASVAWVSSDPAVVKIAADGTATGMAAGNATISMTVKDSASGKSYVERTEVHVAATLSGFKTKTYEIATRQYGDCFLVLTAANAGDEPNELAGRTRVESREGYEYSVKYGDPNDWDDDEQEVLYLDCDRSPDRYDRVTLITDNGDTTVRNTFDLGFNIDRTLRLTDPVRLAVGQTFDPIEAITSYYTLKPTWTVGDSSLIRTNSDGTITALASGETTLTVTAEKPDGTIQTAETQVKIGGGSLTGIKRNEDEEETVTMEVGKTKNISFSYRPAVTMLQAESADSSILTVKLNIYDYSGYEGDDDSYAYGSVTIKALKEGNTTVKVHGENGAELVIPVTVTPTFTFETNLKNQSRMPVGAKLRIQVICKPADMDAEISYYSERSAFTVDENGLMTAAEKGSSVIHVTVNGKEQSFVYYADEAYDIVSLSPGQAKMKAGETLTVEAIGKDGNAIPNYQLEWSSSDSSVVMISSGGVATAVQNGTATLTAKTRNGLTSATLSVSVTDDRLNTLKLPTALKYIEAEAFADNKRIQSVTLGKQVDSIGAKAFAGCTGLVEVIILNDQCQVDASAFANCSDELTIYCKRDSAVWNTCFDAGLTVAER